MNGESSEQRPRGPLESILGALMDRTHPALHWAIIPAFFGVTLFAVLSLTFFLGDAMGLVEFRMRPLGTIFLVMFGSASVGGFAGGVLFHNLPGSRPSRLWVSCTVAGLIWGCAMALMLPLLGPGEASRPPDFRWVQVFIVAGGLLLGLVLGLSFARAAALDEG